MESSVELDSTVFIPVEEKNQAEEKPKEEKPAEEKKPVKRPTARKKEVK